MIRLTIQVASAANSYIPVPCRGVVSGARAVWQTDAVDAGDTITLSRGTDNVCTVTAVNGSGLETEIGVRDATNKDLIFDPDSTVSTETQIEVTPAGAAGIALLTVEFDEYAYTEQTASEA